MEVPNKKGEKMENNEKRMGDNLRIQTLRKKIVNDLNDSELPFEVLRMVLNDVLKEVNELTEEALQEEIKALKEGDSENAKGI